MAKSSLMLLLSRSSSSSSSFLHLPMMVLVLGIVLLQLGNLVQCEFVGLGKHGADDKTITKLKGNGMKTVPHGGDASGIKTLKDGCEDVTVDAKGYIKISYKKGSKAITEGCAVDLVTLGNHEFLEMDIGVSNEKTLKECLGGDKELPNSNMIPFAFSLPEAEFSELKNGTRKGTEGDCIEKGNCEANGGKCMKNADWMAGFFREGDDVHNFVSQIDEPRSSFACKSEKTKVDQKESTFELKVGVAAKGKGRNWLSFGHEGGAYKDCDGKMSSGHFTPYCFKNLREVKLREIIDDAFTDKAFKHLFTLYLLPQKMAHKRLRSGDVHPVSREPLNGIECDELYIKFKPSVFKVLAPSGVPPPSEPPGNKTDEPPPQETTTEPPPTSGSKSGIIIIGAVVGVIVLAVVVGVLVWFFVFRGKGEEEEMYPGATTAGGGGTTAAKTKAGTTVGATQAKTGMGTTMAGTQAKTAAGTTLGGATSKAGGATSKAGGATTTKGGKTTKAGGGTTKK